MGWMLTFARNKEWIEDVSEILGDQLGYWAAQH